MAVTGGWATQCTQTWVGLVGWVELAGSAREGNKGFLFFRNGFQLNIKVERKQGKYLEASRKYDNVFGDGLGYLAQLLYWTSEPKGNRFQMKIGIQFCLLNEDRI
jgi:hypothetical protein